MDYDNTTEHKALQHELKCYQQPGKRKCHERIQTYKVACCRPPRWNGVLITAPNKMLARNVALQRQSLWTVGQGAK
eukprot:2406609-Amphidinium_carterae.1